MGNCQQCTNECNSTAEIQTKTKKGKQMLDQSQELNSNLKGIIKVQAVFKGYMARKKYSFKSTRSSQPKKSSSILNQLGSQEKQLSGFILPNNLQFIQELTLNIESKETQMQNNCNQNFCNADIQFNLNRGSLDNISQISEISRPMSKARQFSMEMNGLCFYPEKKIDYNIINTETQQKLPLIVMLNGASYEGEWKDRKAYGQGKYVMLDGSTYCGDWIDNKANGCGTFQHFDGEIFQGQWVDNQVQGQGKYTFKDGSTYEGQWQNDLPNGQGLQIYDVNWVYEGIYFCSFRKGSFLNGNKHGSGKLIFPDGSKYEGQFKDDMISGIGTLTCCDGRVYVGEWKRGCKHGKGIFTWTDGRKYDGYYVNDERDGYGILEWPSGQKYLGLWKQGYQHGIGQIIKRNGESLRGRWVKGKKVQQSIMPSFPPPY